MELFKASRQWAKRPDDQRYSSLIDMRAASESYFRKAREALVEIPKIHLAAKGKEIYLNGSTGSEAKFTNWGFGQLCSRVGAPASYLRELPAKLAARNLNHGVFKLASLSGDNQSANVLFHKDNGLVVRAFTSDRYSRIWNYEVLDRLIPLQGYGWRVPPARPVRKSQLGTRIATKSDVLDGNKFGLSIREGAPIAPAGLYASDHDMFVFMVNEQSPERWHIRGACQRLFVENSEVGAASLSLTTFLYRVVCGNHIVWGATDYSELRIRHVGFADTRYRRQIIAELRKYADRSVSSIEAKIKKARTFEIAKSKDEVLDLIFGKRILSRKKAEEAFNEAEKHPEDGSPRSVWGFSQGITRISQQSPYADERTRLDRSAGKVLQIAF